jgi:hypothetical protein
MENEIMNIETEVMESEFDTFDMENEESGISTGAAMLIGAGLTLATTAIVKLGKKLWAKHKAKKELRQPDEGQNVEVTDEQIEEIVVK